MKAIEELGSVEAAEKWLLKTFPEIKSRARIPYLWKLHGRPKQLLPITTSNWLQMFMRAGRGGGKTRTGSETVIHKAKEGKTRFMALVGATFSDTRMFMIEGPGGILKNSPPWFYPKYEPSKHTITWPNGVVGYIFTGDKPDGVRGSGFGFAWVDEIQKMIYGREVVEQIRFASRERGTGCQMLFTGTPKPKKIVIELCKDPDTVVVNWATQDNAANLDPVFIKKIITKYKGTRTWDEEVLGKLLLDNPLAMWNQTWLDANRVVQAPTLTYIVVAVDPNLSNTDRSDEMGIVVVGLGSNGHHYILADYSMNGTPLERGRAVASAFYTFRADKIVYEANAGGDLVGMQIALACPEAPQEPVHASKGKRTRAEPISMLHERGAAHMVGDKSRFERLEEQLVDWVPGEESPDRLDAMVWGETHLISVAGQPPSDDIDILEGIERPDFLDIMKL